jgi:hypothetical protein
VYVFEHFERMPRGLGKGIGYVAPAYDSGM